MVTQSQERLTGNDAFEGFAIDLIAEIAEILSKINFVILGLKLEYMVAGHKSIKV